MLSNVMVSMFGDVDAAGFVAPAAEVAMFELLTSVAAAAGVVEASRIPITDLTNGGRSCCHTDRPANARVSYNGDFVKDRDAIEIFETFC